VSNHCLHSTGLSTSHLTGGSKHMKCCDCGRIIEVGFNYAYEPIPGHGPYFTIKKELPHKYPIEECPNRREK